MTITPTTLFRASGVAAALAGLIFVGVQINHPHLDATSITTTDVIARNLLKMLMAALALAGITGMYLRQVTKIGVLGLLGYVLFAAGYLRCLAPNSSLRLSSPPSLTVHPPTSTTSSPRPTMAPRPVTSG